MIEMNKRMRWAGLLALVLVTGAASANDLEKANAAYESGDFDKAFPLYKALAEKGEPEAQQKLAVMLVKGEGGVQDYVQAHQWTALQRIP